MIEEKKPEAVLPEIISPEEKKSTETNEVKKNKKNLSSKKIEPVQSAGSVQDLLLKNIKLSEDIFKQNKKIKRRLGLMLAGGYLKLVLIVAPLILAYIYLAPLLGQVLSQYGSLLGGTDGAAPNLGSMLAPGKLDINSILKNISTQDAIKIQEMLKNISK